MVPFSINIFQLSSLSHEVLSYFYIRFCFKLFMNIYELLTSFYEIFRGNKDVKPGSKVSKRWLFAVIFHL